MLTDVANELRNRAALDEEECSIDATFVMAKAAVRMSEPQARGKGMKILAIVPLANRTRPPTKIGGDKAATCSAG